MNDTDLALLQRFAQARDAEAFSQIVGRHQGLVYNTCLRILGDPCDAEDVAQECFLRLLREAGAVQSSVGGWLHQCATGISIDLVRRRTARKNREEAHSQMNTPSNSDPTWLELSPHLDKALEELPDELRLVVIEHFLQRRTQAEIAKELGVSAMTVSRRVDRGIDELRKKLEKAGVIVSAVLLASLVAEHTCAAVPASVAVALGKVAIAGAVKASAAQVAGASWVGKGIVAGAMTTAGKMKIAAVVVAALAVGGFVAHEMGDEPDEPARRQTETAITPGREERNNVYEGAAGSKERVNALSITRHEDMFRLCSRDCPDDAAYVTLTKSEEEPNGIELAIRMETESFRDVSKTTLSVDGTQDVFLRFDPLFKTGNGTAMSRTNRPTPDVSYNMHWRVQKGGAGVLRIDVDGDGTLETQLQVGIDSEGNVYVVFMPSTEKIELRLNPQAGSATSGNERPTAPPARTVVFPTSLIREGGLMYGFGRLHTRQWEERMPRLGRWEKLASAFGAVEVPAGRALRLVIDSNNYTDLSALRQLGKDDLQVLSIPLANRITEKALPNIRHLTGLRVLYLGGTQITDASLENLTDMQALVHLDLQGCPITDNGLLHLASLKNLESLWLSRTRVTERGVLGLRQALPECDIQWK